MTAARGACCLLALLLAVSSCNAMDDYTAVLRVKSRQRPSLTADLFASPARSDSSSSIDHREEKEPMTKRSSKDKEQLVKEDKKERKEQRKHSNKGKDEEGKKEKEQQPEQRKEPLRAPERDKSAKKLSERVYVGIENNKLKARSALPGAPPLQCHDPDMLTAFLQAVHNNPPKQPFRGPKMMSSTMAWDGFHQHKDTNFVLPNIDRRIYELRHIQPDIAVQTGQSLGKLFSDSVEPGGIPHYFVSHADPWLNARGEVTEHTCYHLYMDYSGLTPERVTKEWDTIKDTVEVRTGCAIYKTRARRMQRFVKCIQPILRKIPNENQESRNLGNFFLGVRQHVGLTVSYNQFTAGNLEPQIAHWARYAHKARSFDEWITRVLGPEDQRITKEMTKYKRVEWGLLNKWDRPYNAKTDRHSLPSAMTPSSKAKLDFSTYWQRIKTGPDDDPKLHSNAVLMDEDGLTPLVDTAQQQVDYTDLRTQAKRCFDVEGTAEDRVELMETFRCLPAMYGAPGVLSNGVGNHDHTWFVAAYGQVEREVMTHPTCARLASEQLAHFGGLDYATGNDEVFNKLVTEKCQIRGRHDWGACLDAETSQCGLYPACYKLAISRVCAAEPLCCPDAAVAKACHKDPHGSDCRDGMNVKVKPRVRFDTSAKLVPPHVDLLVDAEDKTIAYSAAVQALEVPPPTDPQLQELVDEGVLKDQDSAPAFMKPMVSRKIVDQLLEVGGGGGGSGDGGGRHSSGLVITSPRPEKTKKKEKKESRPSSLLSNPSPTSSLSGRSRTTSTSLPLEQHQHTPRTSSSYSGAASSHKGREEKKEEKDEKK